MTIYTLCPPGPAPRVLTAKGKGKNPPMSLKRTAFEYVDRRGFAHTLGEISTCPQNEAAVHDLATGYEMWCPQRRLWLTAPPNIKRRIDRMPPARRDVWLRANSAIYRVASANETVSQDSSGEVYVVPAGYGRRRAEEVLARAVKCGLITFAGRTLRIDGGHASPSQGARDAGTTVFTLRGAKGTARFTREALLASIERGYL